MSTLFTLFGILEPPIRTESVHLLWGLVSSATKDKKKVLKEDVVWEAFKIFDADGSGTVTKAELFLTG